MMKTIKQTSGINLVPTAAALAGLLFAGAASAMGPNSEDIQAAGLDRDDAQATTDNAGWIGGRVGWRPRGEPTETGATEGLDERFVGGRVGRVPRDKTPE